jgi:chromosome segregation ATPase
MSDADTIKRLEKDIQDLVKERDIGKRTYMGLCEVIARVTAGNLRYSDSVHDLRSKVMDLEKSYIVLTAEADGLRRQQDRFKELQTDYKSLRDNLTAMELRVDELESENDELKQYVNVLESKLEIKIKPSSNKSVKK